MTFARDICLFLSLVPAVAGAYSLESYAKVQTGGYAGFATLGLGVEGYNRHVRGELLYGYVPPAFAGSQQHILGFKTDVAFPPFTVANTGEWVVAYLGGGLLYNLSPKVFVKLPDNYPKKYYPSTALHWEAHLGTELRFGQHGGYLEANMHELAWLAVYDNPRYFGIEDLMTYTVGYKYAFSP